MTFQAIDAWWWHFLFILVAGWFATDLWRLLGVYFGGRISEESEALAATSLALRLAAVGTGFVAYLRLGRSVPVSILVAEAVLIAGMAAGL